MQALTAYTSMLGLTVLCLIPLFGLAVLVKDIFFSKKKDD